MSRKFRLNQKVMSNGSYGGNEDIKNGSCGIIVETGKLVGVRWDNKIHDGHNCNGKCKRGHGWFLDEEHLKPVDGMSDIEIKTIKTFSCIFVPVLLLKIVLFLIKRRK